MKWLKNILDTWRKGLKYDELSKNYEDLQTSLTDSIEFSDDLRSELLEEIDKNELLNSKIKELLNEGIINVEEVKDWYEIKYGQAIWTYNYDGTGSKDVKGALAVNYDVDLKALAHKIMVKYNLFEGVNPSYVVEVVMKYFLLKNQWTYLSDVGEYWSLAEETVTDRRGDCDDLAILMHNTIYYVLLELGLEISYWRLKLCAGSLISSEGGHCFNIWLHDDGEWYVVESTYDLLGSFKKTWLKTPIKNNNLYHIFWGFARKDRSWKGNDLSLEPYNKTEVEKNGIESEIEL